MKRKQLLSEAQIRRMAAIAGIPVIGLVSEKLDIQAEDSDATVEETTEETVEETTDIEEGGKYYEEDEDPTDDASAEAEEAGGEDIPQEKIEGLVDAVLAAIEQETGVPAQRVDDAGEEEAEDLEPEMDAAEEPAAEEPAAEEPEMMEATLAEKIAAAVQSVLDEDAALEESNCTTNEEEETKNEESQLDEITQAVIARLLATKSEG